jgi:DNA polymerase-3 subunit delta'
MNKLIGHHRQRNSLSRLIKNGRLPSTLLFAGIPGIGKMGVAREVARHLLCEAAEESDTAGCGQCHSCRLMDTGNHPDLHILNLADPEQVGVDDVRSMLDTLNLKSFLGGRKLAIFNDADNLSIVGANIILKSLEEPRPGCYFILVLSNPTRLPATLLSRCQRWYFDRLSPSEVKEVLEARGETDVPEALTIMADGSLAALDSVRASPERWDEVRAAFEAAFQGEEDKVSKAAQEWANDKTGLRERVSFMRMFVQQKLVQSASHPEAASVWAHTLQDVLDAEYLLLDRHVNPAACLLHVLRGCNRNLSKRYMELPNTHPTLLDAVID